MTSKAKYFFIAGNTGGSTITGVSEAKLLDTDLIRGNGDGERVQDLSGAAVFDGFKRFVQTGNTLDTVERESADGEALATVTFRDGTSLESVKTLFDSQTFNFGTFNNLYLFDTAALASVGKTIYDISGVEITDFVDHDLSYADLGFSEPAPEPVDEPTDPGDSEPAPQANYFFQVFRNGDIARTGVASVQLVDDDGIRGNDDVEIRTADDLERPIFNSATRLVRTGSDLSGFELVEDQGEVTTTVFFKDGSSVSGVNGLVNISSGVGGTGQQFLLDVRVLEAVGKSYSDIASVDIDGRVDHDLTFADFGFDAGERTPIDEVPVLDEGPTYPDDFNLLNGTDGRDRLFGTDGADLLIGNDGRDRLVAGDGDDILVGGDGNDRLVGGAGADIFVFGADAHDGGRDRDVIRDFEAGVDTLVLEAGAEIRRTFERNGDLHIQLEGDHDRIILRDQDADALQDIVFQDDLFFG